MSDHADSEARTASSGGPISLMGATPIIHLEKVCKRYGDLVAVDSVDLSVHPGQVLAIIGPSGSGKSTLLRCINYLERPESGRIVVGEISLDSTIPPSHAELSVLRRRVGMVFQSFNLFPHLTVLQNVSLAQRRVLRRTPEEAERRSLDLLATVGLADKAHQYPSRCSGGQQQRIAIARALALEPDVMLFDEPTSSLDPELGLEVLTVMRELASAGMTMIVVTHEMHFAEDVSNEVVVMAGGRIVEQGPSREVMRSPKQERTRRFLSAVLDR
jgi:polar amino acid transport system ATP-binding protein